jgi:acyl-CoA reductase-like NAD-dependent aldehyde dehydrogenase
LTSAPSALSDAPAPVGRGRSLEQVRATQRQWAALPISERLQIVRKLRGLIAENGKHLANLFSPELIRSPVDSLTTEIIPLAESCRFLELNAKQILSPQRLSKRGRPMWLRKVGVEVVREPFGIVLVIGPSNYPLFLPAAQALQALVAGNAAMVKPGRGALAVVGAFAQLIERAGLPHNLLTILSEDVSEATEAIRSGVHKIVMTGSSTSGRAVLREAAEHVVPSVVELSGNDAVFVLPSADVKRAAKAVRFGRELNGGQTCIAPQRVYVHASVAESFRFELGTMPDLPVESFASDEDAIQKSTHGDYALGAAIFGNEVHARRLASGLNAGVIVINDVIVPTADPRVPFGGRGLSGFGKTRGAEGLLEMTTAKAVVTQGARRLRHLEPVPAYAEDLFAYFLKAQHGATWTGRLSAWRGLVQLVKEKRGKA